MLRFSYLIQHSPQLAAVYQHFMRLKQLQEQLKPFKTSCKYPQVNSVLPLIGLLKQQTATLQKQFLLLSNAHISLDSAIAQHLQRVRKIAQTASEKLCQAGASYAPFRYIFCYIYDLALLTLSLLEATGWNALEPGNSAYVLASQKEKRLALIQSSALDMKTSHPPPFYLEYLNSLGAPPQQFIEQPNDLDLAQSGQRQSQNDCEVNVSVVRSPRRDFGDEEATRLLASQKMAQIVIPSYPMPKMFDLHHDFHEMNSILLFRLAELPDFAEIYELLAKIRSIMPYKRYKVALRRLYVLAFAALTNFDNLKLLSTGFGFPFESSARYSVKLNQVLFGLAEGNARLAKFLNCYVVHLYRRKMDIYTSFQLTRTHRGCALGKPLFSGDDVNANDVGCLLFYCMAQLIMSGFRANFAGGWALMPEMVMRE